MRVTSVSIEAFKSLYEVDCKLDRFTVITGPNGAGKSNFVDALNFLGEAYSHGIEIAVSRAGGFENIAHRRTRRAKRPIRFSVDIEIDESDIRRIYDRSAWIDEETRAAPTSDVRMLFKHQFSLATESQGLAADFRVAEEAIELSYLGGPALLTVKKECGEAPEIKTRRKGWGVVSPSVIYPFDNPSFRQFMRETSQSRTELMTSLFNYAPLLAGLRSGVGALKVFQLSPFQCRTPGVPTPNATLERHGENLPGAADHLRRNDPRAWEAVERAMRVVLPGLEEISIAHTEDRRLALQFREKGVGRAWNGNEVSDGTMQSLAIFVALFDRRNLMLVIEEPENSIHPWILRRIVDQLSEATSRQQVIMTTHSPILLDYVAPEAIRLMTIHGGRSLLRPFLDYDPDLRAAIVSGELGVFEAYDSGAIPEAVPQGLGGW